MVIIHYYIPTALSSIISLMLEKTSILPMTWVTFSTNILSITFAVIVTGANTEYCIGTVCPSAILLSVLVYIYNRSGRILFSVDIDDTLSYILS